MGAVWCNIADSLCLMGHEDCYAIEDWGELNDPRCEAAGLCRSNVDSHQRPIASLNLPVRTRACGVEGDVQHCLWATTLKQSSGCYQ